PDRADEARARRARSVHRTHAGGALRGHAEAGGHRAGDGARSVDPLPRRAVVGTRSDHRRRARRDDPAPRREPRRHVRDRHARPRQRLRRDRPRHPSRPSRKGHHRRGRSAPPARRDDAPARPGILPARSRAGGRLTGAENPMALKANYFKLGLFVIGAIVSGAIVLVVIGSGRWFQPKLTIETYFNESVQGLDIGSKLKYRGVAIGEVTKI